MILGFISLAVLQVVLYGLHKIDLRRMERRLMRTLDDVLNDVQEERTQIASLSTLTAGLRQQLKDALAGVLTPEQQAKVDAIFDGVEANKAAVVAAINANTDPAPPATDAPANPS